MENHNFENQGTFNREMNSRHLQMFISRWGYRDRFVLEFRLYHCTGWTFRSGCCLPIWSYHGLSGHVLTW